jgi:hypothetical protein
MGALERKDSLVRSQILQSAAAHPFVAMVLMIGAS